MIASIPYDHHALTRRDVLAFRPGLERLAIFEVPDGQRVVVIGADGFPSRASAEVVAQ